MFIEIKASKSSLSKRKLVYGAGVNDADYIVMSIINGKQNGCPYYRKWQAMLQRCYSDKYHAKHPTYKGCTVCDEWLTFSNFKRWMMKRDWKNKNLDKDLLSQGNKIYTSELCLFVSSKINTLLTDKKSNRGDYPIGVSLGKTKKRYESRCNVDGKCINLGYFDTTKEAHEAYKNFKYKLISEVALQQTEPLKSALLNYKIGE